MQQMAYLYLYSLKFIDLIIGIGSLAFYLSDELSMVTIDINHLS